MTRNIQRLIVCGAALFFLGAAPSNVLDSRVNQANMSRTICHNGWAHSVRPSELWTWTIKRLWTLEPRKYELDHIIPLELGGAPYSLANLQLQPWKEAKIKDELENNYHTLVCQGKMSLQEARDFFWDNWRMKK